MRYLLTISLMVLGQLVIGQERIGEQQISNLHRLAKVWGFLKYYHPAVVKGKYDWDQQLLAQIPRVMTKTTPEEVNLLLVEWVAELSKVQATTTYEVPGEVKLMPPNEWITDEVLLGKRLSQALGDLVHAKRGKKSHYVNLGGSQGEFTNEEVYTSYKGDEVNMNLLALFRYWNIIQYFYPYRYLTNDWDSVLTHYIPRFYDASTSIDYKMLIQELATEINDAHAIMYDEDLKNHFGARAPAFDVRNVEGKYVVYRLLPGFDHDHGVARGTVITHINGEVASEKVRSLRKYVPASNEPGKEYGAIQMALRTNSDGLSLTLESGHTVSVPAHDLQAVRPQWLRIPSHKILPGNIGYLYLGSVEPGTVDEIFAKFSSTSGLVVDLRCYPSHYMMELFKYISEDFDPFLWGTKGSTAMPGLFTFDPVTSKVTANPEYYRQRIALLVDELTLSQSESYAMAFQVNPNTTIIGSTTAGADGDAVPVILPGDVMTAITSWGAYYPDGGETQGIGIIPDVTIRPTIMGLQSGADELLDLAVKILTEDK